MGILRRLSLIVKSYVSATGDRLDRMAAEEELRAAKAKRQAAEEVAQALDQARRPETPAYPTPSRQPIPDKLAADYRLLGMAPDASLEDVEAAWRNLASRADPKRFPSGSDEEQRAAQILKSLNEAYARIREAINPTEGRFGQLEI